MFGNSLLVAVVLNVLDCPYIIMSSDGGNLSVRMRVTNCSYILSKFLSAKTYGKAYVGANIQANNKIWLE